MRLIIYYTCSFWSSVPQISGEEFRASSLLTSRQNLRSTLLKEKNIDIIYDSEFQSSYAVFDNYLRHLKEVGKGFVRHHPDIHKNDIDENVRSIYSCSASMAVLVVHYVTFL
jgi:hypothetical protein